MPRLVLLLGGLTALTPASIDMYAPAFPTVARALGATPAAVQWTLGAYLVGLALGQVLYGPLTDRLGRRRPLAAGLAVYVLASVGCALARTIEALIVLRLVQAVGGASCLVIPRAVVRDRFDPQASARVYSQLMLVLGVAPILAPVVGGQLLRVASWRAIFVLLAALGVAGLVAALVALPESRPPRDDAPAGAAGTALRDYAGLLSDRRFMGYAASGGLAMGGMFAYISGSPFVLIDLHHLSPETFGVVFGANAAALIAASQVNAALVRYVRTERILDKTLMVTAALGLALLLEAATGIGGLPALLVLLALYMASRGFIQPNAVALALAHHPQRAGSASALYGVLQFGTATLASALVGALHDGTARPMAAVMAAVGVASVVLQASLVGRHPRA